MAAAEANVSYIASSLNCGHSRSPALATHLLHTQIRLRLFASLGLFSLLLSSYSSFPSDKSFGFSSLSPTHNIPILSTLSTCSQSIPPGSVLHNLQELNGGVSYIVGNHNCDYSL